MQSRILLDVKNLHMYILEILPKPADSPEKILPCQLISSHRPNHNPNIINDIDANVNLPCLTFSFCIIALELGLVVQSTVRLTIFMSTC